MTNQMNDWLEGLTNLLSGTVKGRMFRPRISGTTIYLNYYNLPEDLYHGRSYNGAEMENNRIMLMVQFPGNHGHYDDIVKEGKARVKESVNFLSRDYALRGKTTTPEKMAEYIAVYFNRIAAEVPPKYTHSEPPKF